MPKSVQLEMQKVILDTNVIVSAFISNSIPTKILHELVLTQKVELYLSEEIFSEYIEVMNRDKFSKFPDFKSKAFIVLHRLREIATFFIPEEKVDVLSDKSGNKFLELALVSSADYLITGNTADFQLTEFGRTKILTPRKYWDNCKDQV